MLTRSLVIALVVGSILVAINQGDLLVQGRFGVALMWKVALTYAVPFLVATWSALVNSRTRPERPPVVEDTMTPRRHRCPDGAGREQE